MSIQTVIDRIRTRPGMYLGSKSITALWHFLNGYHMAEFERDTEKCRKLSLLPLDFGFMHEYVNFRFDLRNNRGWCQNILDICDGNEEKGLDKFFELYDEFSAIEIKRYTKAVLNAENIKFNDNMFHSYAVRYGVKEPRFPNPKAVYAVELSIGAFVLVVEDDEGVDAEREFFKEINDILVEAERHFGKISGWEEVREKNINLLK